MVLRIQILDQLCLDQPCQLFPSAAAIIIEDLRSVHILFRIAVLMDAHRENRIRLLNLFDPAFHILHFLIGSRCIIQSILRLSGQHHPDSVCLQILSQFLCDPEIDILLRCSVDTNLPRVIPAMAGIDHYRRYSVRVRIIPLQGIHGIYRFHICRRFPAKYRHRHKQQAYHHRP